MTLSFEIRSTHRCFGGLQGFYQHRANSLGGLPMRFSVYQPPQANENRVPVLYFLAGLTCTEETFMIKAGVQRLAAQYGYMLVSMDTSPRQTGIVGEADDWEIGSGAGFYLDACLEPWSKFFHMESYVTKELYQLILEHFPADPTRIGIFGHSMGGHGALILALRNPSLYQSVSAFAPITAPSDCPWGQKAFNCYLGEAKDRWIQHDATALIAAGHKVPTLLIDQGLNDPFLATQLNIDRFETTCQLAKQPLILRRHEGYDHGYYFISTFIEDHFKHHETLLAR